MKNARMRKGITLMLILIVGCLSIAGCSKNENGNTEEITTEVKVSEGLKIQRSYYSYLDQAIETLKDNLKNPSSLKIMEVSTFVGVDENYPDFYIYYSATNGFGGTIDGYADIMTNPKYKAIALKEGKASSFKISKQQSTGKTKNSPYEIAEGVWSDSKTESGRKNLAFMIDLDDYYSNK